MDTSAPGNALQHFFAKKTHLAFLPVSFLPQKWDFCGLTADWRVYVRIHFKSKADQGSWYADKGKAPEEPAGVGVGP